LRLPLRFIASAASLPRHVGASTKAENTPDFSIKKTLTLRGSRAPAFIGGSRR
jgi:hypothetical protein